MVRLSSSFSQLAPAKAVVIGDFLLDTYTIGKAKRISPEAPVAVVHVEKEEHRPGGAGNVVLNLISLGCQVTAIGRIGLDHSGTLLLDTLRDEDVDVEGMVIQQCYPTPVKNRVIAENQQMVRVDREILTPLPEMLEQQIIEALPALFQDVKVIAISDYGKGFLTRTLLSAVIELGRALSIPIIADPKGIEFTKYSGSTVLKPNLSEAYAASGLPSETPLELVAEKIFQHSQSEILMITRSEAGISLFNKAGERSDFPVKIREVKDVTGAGDTVLAMLACALANDLSIEDAVQLSNVAAGIAIERFGCARVSLSDLARRLLEYDVINKVFDEDHLFALQEALRDRKFALLGVNEADGITAALFNTIRELASKPEHDLLLYIRETEPSSTYLDLLASLHDVNFIIVKGESLLNLCQKMHPTEVYELKQNQLEQLPNATALL